MKLAGCRCDPRSRWAGKYRFKNCQIIFTNLFLRILNQVSVFKWGTECTLYHLPAVISKGVKNRNFSYFPAVFPTKIHPCENKSDFLILALCLGLSAILYGWGDMAGLPVYPFFLLCFSSHPLPPWMVLLPPPDIPSWVGLHTYVYRGWQTLEFPTRLYHQITDSTRASNTPTFTSSLPFFIR